MGQRARRGYIRSSVSPGLPRIYGFHDVAEAMVVHELLDRGVKHLDIRRAISVLEGAYGDWPLTEAPLATASAGNCAAAAGQYARCPTCSTSKSTQPA